MIDNPRYLRSDLLDVIKQLLVFALTAALLGGASAQTRQKVDKAADLPRFSYRIDDKVEEVVRDDARFATFAQALRKDIDSVLARYEIPDKAVERGYVATLAQLDYLEGRYDDALVRLDRLRALEEKPADQLMSGLAMRAMIAAGRKVGTRSTDAYRQEVASIVRAELDRMPYATVQNEVRENKASAEIVGESLIIGSLRERLQPIVDKTGSLSSDFAPALVNARYRLLSTLPLKQVLIDAYAGYLAAHRVDKPDIWAARDVALPAGERYAPVNIAIWDSGVDTALFRDRLVMARGQPAVIGFDRFENPANSALQPIPAELASRVPRMKSLLKGFSDLQSNLDTPEAAEVKKFLSELKPEQYKPAIEEITLAGNYIHGTHVAGIAMAGNPYARIATARIEFDWHLQPDPCPTRELALKNARNVDASVAFFKRNNVRVVNMSWGGSVQDIENALEQCALGKDTEDRKRIARDYFEIARNALTRAIRSAPEILFVAAGGNQNSDASFAESIPAAIDAPNLLTVGAVDRAGDEASFTSYGATVVAHANGYQVESVIPGGEKLAESGTSMAAPQATNLVAKILAVNPKLRPTEVIALIRATVEKTPDGRRMLLHPAQAIAEAKRRRA
ncbi:MAG TPA: S8 family serine peptidase [Casimicrobiaceae bacterium]|nr:S8 family serine peptidase [Casimicrobiaceae bacterium]